MMISFEFRSQPIKISQKVTIEWLRSIAAQEGYSIGNLHYVFCNNAEIVSVNKHFLGHDYPTDVITFDYTIGKCINGDVFISTDCVEENAGLWDNSKCNEVYTEFYRVTVHALLHLLGHKDKTKKDFEAMKKKEDEALAVLRKMVTIN